MQETSRNHIGTLLGAFWTNSDNILNELYINNGNYLNEDPTTIFPSLFTGSNSWGDFDNDGDPDLIISGQTANPNSSVSRLYKNDPIGRLSEVTTIDVLDGCLPR